MTWADHPYFQISCSNEGDIVRFRYSRRKNRCYYPLAVRITRSCAYVTIKQFPWTPAALIILEAFTTQRIPPAWLRYLDDNQSNIHLSNLAAERPRARIAFQGRPQRLDELTLLQAFRRWEEGEPTKQLAKAYNVDPATLKARLRELGWQKYRVLRREKLPDAVRSPEGNPSSANSSTISTSPSPD